MKCLPTHTSLLYDKTGVINRGNTCTYFSPKTQIVGIRLNRIAEAVLTRTHHQCFEQTNITDFKIFLMKFSIFSAKINPCIFLA